MKWLRIAYDTIWFRCHPVIGRPDGTVIYPSWYDAFMTARILAS